MPPKFRSRSRPAHLIDHAEDATPTGVGEDAPSNYVVGKNKPPVSRRFGQPGGNRPGRKPKVRGFAALMKKELATKVTLFKDGREVRLSKEELIVNVIANAAIKGDNRKIELLARHNLLDLREADEEHAADVELDLEDDGLTALRILLGLQVGDPLPSGDDEDKQ